ncbi:sodium:calcium antiporter [Syntrophomonas wolfei]|jgi:cation:H+ antiporter|uniref:sodium:calcium antiporter n=1 Tax=Syntrophomonas wolfei TaxID=863 RepID=UPI000772F1B6|nr:sodium:calcium antiporter [Syntrophomonas wolfei]
MSSIGILILSLGIILLGAEVFVNGVEWLGEKLNLSEGAVGSVLAAVGTALPETLIPVIAIVFGHGKEGHDIGIGAILGAPLMLSTLAMFVTGLAVVFFSRRRIKGSKVQADYSSMTRDLSFFIIVFAAAIITGTMPPALRHWQLIIAGFMVLSYFLYVYVMISEERDLDSSYELPSCYFARKEKSPRLSLVIGQVLFALLLIIIGADMFVGAVKEVAVMYQVPAFVLALIITPIATELPEKFNSVIWISREKDSLALGNITGAMVFQSSLIPALGIFLTDWQLSGGAFLSALLALAAAGILYIELLRKKHITAGTLLLMGVFYGIFLVGVFEGIIR